MAIIGNVDYQSIPLKTDKMRESGKNLCNEMHAMYNTVERIHDDWYGARYNDLVKAFNNIRPSINSMLELVFTTIPATLDTVANNYSKVDRQVPLRAVSEEKPQIVEDIPVINDEGKFRYITASVEEKRKAVEANISKSVLLLDEFEGIYRTIDWESDAATVYRAKFTELKGELITSFEDLKKQFSELMAQAEKDIQATENANTVN